MGRPRAYKEEVATEILERMAEGQSLSEICRDDDMPVRSTVLKWVAIDEQGFTDRYIKACEARAWLHADELMDVADDGRNDWMERQGEDGSAAYVVNGEAIARSRLRVDTRKWVLSKLLPKYADKSEVKQTGELNVNIVRFSDPDASD